MDYLPCYIDSLSSEVIALKKTPIYLYNKLLIYLINNGIVQYCIFYRHFMLDLIDETIEEKSMLMGKIKIVLLDGSYYNNQQKECLLEILDALLLFLKKYQKMVPFEITMSDEGFDGGLSGLSRLSGLSGLSRLREEDRIDRTDTWDQIFEPRSISLKRPPVDPNSQYKLPDLDLLTKPSSGFIYVMDQCNIEELEGWLLETI
jgi:hypothetical protein